MNRQVRLVNHPGHVGIILKVARMSPDKDLHQIGRWHRNASHQFAPGDAAHFLIIVLTHHVVRVDVVALRVKINIETFFDEIKQTFLLGVFSST